MSGRLPHRLIGVGLGVGIAAAFIAWHGRHTGARATGPGARLLPENTGAIRAIAIQYTPESAGTVLPAYRALLRQMAPDVVAYVICGDADAGRDFAHAVASWGLPRPERFRYVSVGAPITTWCKDRFLVAAPGAEDSRATLITQQAGAGEWGARTNDWLVAPALARHESARFAAVELPLRFDAGDLLATEGCLFVSDALWEKNRGVTVRSRAELLAKLKSLFDRRIVWLGGEPGAVPDHHIGMYVAPMDGETALVGDAELGKQLWEELPEPARADLAGERAPDFSEAKLAVFRSAAQQLRSEGFRVVSLPLVPFADSKVFLTYTNGVFETRDGTRVVYMPTCGIPVLDEAARRAYAAEGFAVRRIPARDLFPHRGTIGCLVNVLERAV
ncbi:MAG: agmatine deiminase family protein [Armatimonadota bacterium]|jgi:hypothetical protein